MTDTLCAAPIVADDFAKMEPLLTSKISSATSLDDVLRWLKSQACVQSVLLTDYLIKTEPPRRELLVDFKMRDGSVSHKALDVAVLADGQLRFAGIHDL